MSYLVENSNIPKARQMPASLQAQKCDYDAYCKLADIKDDIEDFVKNGNSLYITSAVTGNGKTSWAIKLLMKYFDTVWAGNGFRVRGLFIHTPSFLLSCKDFSNKNTDFTRLTQLLHTVDLVVWDDIGSTDISSYDYSQLLMYLDSRVGNNLSNIYTGNLVDKERLDKALGCKLSSRILSNKTTVIKFNGGDMR